MPYINDETMYDDADERSGEFIYNSDEYDVALDELERDLDDNIEDWMDDLNTRYRSRYQELNDHDIAKMILKKINETSIY